MPACHPEDGSDSTIHGGTFIMTNGVQREGETGLGILHRAAALEALCDSGDTFPSQDVTLKHIPSCSINYWPSETEMDPKPHSILRDWTSNFDIDSSNHILWLYGPAGAGKSAVMQTLSRHLQDAGHPGGSFFFKRGHPDCGHARALFVTLAYDLALHIPEFRVQILQSVEQNPSVVGRSVVVQLQRLILDPCRSLARSTPAIILIDGLDECDDLHMQQEILCAIGNAARGHPDLPLRFVIASRPEPHIRETFQGSSLMGLTSAFSITQSFSDVETYLRDEFTNDLDLLVSKSSGYFIYASTVIKFIDDKNFRPTERLEIVQQLSIEASFDTPFYALDQLYTQTLSAAPARSRFLPILLAILNFDLTSSQLEELLELRPGDVHLALRGLHSILKISEGDASELETVALHHASLRDFLLDPTRSGELCVGGLQLQMDLARSVLKILSSESKHHPGHVTWYIVPAGINYLTTSISPSIDLVPLIRRFNPKYLWYRSWQDPRSHAEELKEITKALVDWLKVGVSTLPGLSMTLTDARKSGFRLAI
ncbi:hypothetical protein C8R44DRAFT_892183 [Mycena epipterygia]|nr:hypothetical protein C8R44DRAFT_892183 [Mycena epipterygia]